MLLPPLRIVRVALATLLLAVAGRALADTARYPDVSLEDSPVAQESPDAGTMLPVALESTTAASAALDAGPADCGGQCGQCPQCTCKKQKALEAAAAAAYKPMFYDNKFDYLCDPCYTDWHLGENAKRIGPGPWITVDAGGQYRLRYHHEENIRNHPALVPERVGPDRLHGRLPAAADPRLPEHRDR